MNLVNADSPSEAHSVERRKADLCIGGAREAAVKEELGQCREAVPHRLSVSLCPLARASPPSSKQSSFSFLFAFFRDVSVLKNRAIPLCGFLPMYPPTACQPQSLKKGGDYHGMASRQVVLSEG